MSYVGLTDDEDYFSEDFIASEDEVGIIDVVDFMGARKTHRHIHEMTNSDECLNCQTPLTRDYSNSPYCSNCE